jgi:predicted Zn-dependent protease
MDAAPSAPHPFLTEHQPLPTDHLELPMRPALIALLSFPLLAQVPEGLRPDFFKQEAKVLMVAAADKARAQAPRDARVLAEAGRVYLAAGHRDRAEDAFRRALEAAPSDPGVHYLVAQGWLRGGFPAEARAAMSRMPTHSARAVEWLARAGVQFMEAGLVKEAEGYMDQAHAASPADWELCLDFGRAAVKGRQPEAAGRWFMRVVRLRPRDERAWTAIATAYAEGSDPRERP